MKYITGIGLFAAGILLGWWLSVYYHNSAYFSAFFHSDSGHSVIGGTVDSAADNAAVDAKRSNAAVVEKGYPPQLNHQRLQADFFQHWCDQQEFDSAIDFLTLLNRKGKYDLFDIYRQVFFNSLTYNTNLSLQNQLQWLDAYLSYFHDDYDFLIRKSDVETAIEEYIQALTSLYDAQLYARTTEERKKVRIKLDSFIEQQTKRLINANPLVLSELFDLVLSKEPQYIPLSLHIASAYLQMKEYEKADGLLSSIPLDGIHDQAILDLQKQMQNTKTQGMVVEIPLKKMGDHFLVDFEIEGYGVVPLLIDTGASYTTLSNRLMDSLDSRFKTILMDQVDLQTANGTVAGELYQLQSVALGQFQLVDVTVVSVPLPNLVGAEGLLGMNVLKQFKFSIDQERSLLLLK